MALLIIRNIGVDGTPSITLRRHVVQASDRDRSGRAIVAGQGHT